MEMIPKKYWKEYSKEDCGTLHMERWNGGGKGLKYLDGTCKAVTTGGGYAQRYPYIFTSHYGRNTRMEGPFYRFYGIGYVQVSEWNSFYRDVEELPKGTIYCYSEQEFEEKEKTMPAEKLIEDFIYKVNDESSKIKVRCDGDINNFSSIQEIELIAIGVGLPIVKVTRDKESKTKDEFVFLVDITHDRQEFKYKNIIKTRSDFNKSLESAINALEGFDGLEEYAEDLASFK